MSKTKKMGRPTLPMEEQRNQRVTLRFTREEWDTIIDQLHGQAVAEGIRELALMSARRKEAIISGEKIARPPRLSREQLSDIADKLIAPVLEESQREILKRIKNAVRKKQPTS
ncbi:MAG: hypothetical protein LBQ54_13205 [Planctomycetaceae bacterium]|jgi:hypothetical protein|nr:hypothetical protein [Planctomycetaceae bacterium]